MKILIIVPIILIFCLLLLVNPDKFKDLTKKSELGEE